ncbi:MAG: hypothetical protein F7B20_00840 [Aeropyrum sp.]|nr:hypothetical protein [Aeropyrum sp.]MCE4616510.1 hypothetical protein [Aeropyrum sp.]
MSRESRLVDRERLIEWVKKRITELEEELEVAKTILEVLEKGGVSEAPLPGEKGEDIKVGRRRVARLYKGETHVRIVFEEPQPLPEEVEIYLRNVEEELRSLQARIGGVVGEDLATLDFVRVGEGSVREISFRGLYTTVEHLKAKAALKYAAETIHYISRAMNKLDS